MKKYIISLCVTLIFGFVLFYLMLPALNFTSWDFYFFLFILSMIFVACLNSQSIKFKRGRLEVDKGSSFIVIASFSIFILILLINTIFSPFFNASGYSKRIEINEDANFKDDVAQINFSQLPLLDKDSSRKLGDRVMGQMPELVSQFNVSNLYTQINYNEKIIRVTPLEYADVIKWISNRKEGVKGYITVDSVSGEAKLIKLDKGMKYVKSGLFNDNLLRHVRFKYPTEILGECQFELDNKGNPYWIIPTIKYSGVGLKRDVSGIIMVDPISGKTKKYKVKDVPKWVDHVYTADIILEQVNSWGKYRGGFFNSIFGQKNVVQTTKGYNYTVMNDDVYLYTGVTSAVADEANLGFILTNLRTKETNFYSVPGAEEYSAMASAVGQVQQMNYTATFPLLVNLNGKPTYLISLKDNAGLVKMYAFVDVNDYQKVTVTDSSKGIEEALKNYLNENSIDSGQANEKEIEVKTIKSAVIDGTTYYYIIDTDDKKYKISIKLDKVNLPFIKEGDKLKVNYYSDKEVIDVKSIKIN